jgi:hypothetical protein
LELVILSNPSPLELMPTLPSRYSSRFWCCNGALCSTSLGSPLPGADWFELIRARTTTVEISRRQNKEIELHVWVWMGGWLLPWGGGEGSCPKNPPPMHGLEEP